MVGLLGRGAEGEQVSCMGEVREGEVGEVRQEGTLKFNCSLGSLAWSQAFVLGPVLCSPAWFPAFLNLALSPGL